MLHNNIYVTTLLILCFITLSDSWKLFLSEGEGTFHNSTRIKRQIQTCTLPDHPPNGRYTLIGSRELFKPNSIINEYSSIQLTCTEPYVTKSANSQSLCIEGLWSPPLSNVEECVSPITTTTTTSTTTTTTAAGIQLSSSGNVCVLPSHPRQATFSVAGSIGPYTPFATAPEFSTLRLTCFNSYVSEKSNPQTLCIEGAWSPPISTLGTCIHAALPNSALGTNCFLPEHPSNGEFRIIGSENKLYVPDSSVPEHSSIDLTCRSSHTTQNKLARALCHKGEWFPPILELGECVRKGALSTTTQATTEESICTLPEHPANGRFKILGTENYDYMPHSAVQEYTNIQLMCTENSVENKIAVCFEGKWSPTIVDLGRCIQNKISTVTESSGTRNGCILPPNQSHGTYDVSNDNNFDIIIFTCNKGYYPLYQSHFCNNGTWYPPLFECIRTCPPFPKSETYTATCRSNRRDVDCSSEALEGTEIHINCNTFFEYKSVRAITKCQDGTWTHDIAPCTPECGKRKVPVQELIIGGQFSEKGEYPWLVGIYLRNQSHICGGSIISRFFVLSAAHCFTTYNNTLQALNPVDEAKYLVAAGKHYRTLHDPRDIHRQITDVKRIYVPTLYLGIVQNYRQDYAVLQVDVPFNLSEYVQLVCIDWESNYLKQDFRENNTALVSGWGYTLEASSPSEELKKLKVHFKSRPSCNENLPKDFAHRYFTEDKLCAGYIGQNVCQGDSGGGLYFEHESVYYVRGIVSVSPHSKVGCSLKHYALYTDVSKHLDIITEETGRVL